MPTILITGANRGLGLEFCRQYATSGWRVIACCRQPTQAAALQKLASQHTNISTYALEVDNFAQIDAVAYELRNEIIDVLLNNAGIYGDKQDYDFGHLDYELWASTLRINCMAPVKMAEAFMPHLTRACRPILASVTSLMGSMGDNRSGGSIFYRTSKAALNAAMKTLSIDLKPSNIGVILLHPGWVKTDMGTDAAPTLPEESISGMRRVLDNFTLQQTGNFINFKGETLPW